MAGQGISCSACGRHLARGDDFITLDGGEAWCAACWARRFGPRSAAAETPPPGGADDVQLVVPADAEAAPKPPPLPVPEPAAIPAAAPRGKTCGLAVAALVVALAGIVLPVIGGLAAIVIGVVALGRISRNRGLRGSGLAVAGIVTGVVDVLGWVALAILLFF